MISLDFLIASLSPFHCSCPPPKLPCSSWPCGLRPSSSTNRESCSGSHLSIYSMSVSWYLRQLISTCVAGHLYCEVARDRRVLLRQTSVAAQRSGNKEFQRLFLTKMEGLPTVYRSLFSCSDCPAANSDSAVGHYLTQPFAAIAPTSSAIWNREGALSGRQIMSCEYHFHQCPCIYFASNMALRPHSLNQHQRFDASMW